MNEKKHPFGSSFEAFFYPTLLLLSMWLVFWAEHLFRYDFHLLGVLPRSLEGIKGILFMPFIHSAYDIAHIVNNSMPVFFLLAALIYFYRDIALRVFLFGWLFTGAFLWMYAQNKGAYHIGMSGIIYMLAAFLFTSGVIRKFKPLQAISLFIIFAYGSMVWGIFPLKEHVSWEGHFVGAASGILLAFAYQKHGPQRPKYQYEVEKEMGIEPPDFEAELNERIRLAAQAEEERSRQEAGFSIVYDYVSKNSDLTPDETPPK